MHCKNYDKPFETVRTKTTTRYTYDKEGRLVETTTMTYEDHFDVDE